MRKITRMKLTFWSIALSTVTLGLATDQNVVSNSSNTVADLGSSVGGETVSKNPDDVRFYVFSNKSNVDQAKEIVFKGQRPLNASSIDCSKVFKILVHGFGANGLMKSGFPANVKIEYLKTFPYTSYNIISVDYGPLASCKDPSSSLCYQAAVENLKIAGLRIGKFIIALHDVCGPQFLDLVHVLGHSLGAHVAGFAANTVTNLTNYKIGRLTGLDPAGPLFHRYIPYPRMMAATDAKFTEGYHSCAGAYGTTCPVGKIDVFLNGGFTPQPSCLTGNLTADLTSVAGCSHAFSHVSYANTIAFGDPAKNSSASVQACRLLAVDCLVALDVSSQACNTTVVYGEYAKSGPVVTGTYTAKYPPI